MQVIEYFFCQAISSHTNNGLVNRVLETSSIEDHRVIINDIDIKDTWNKDWIHINYFQVSNISAPL